MIVIGRFTGSITAPCAEVASVIAPGTPQSAEIREILLQFLHRIGVTGLLDSDTPQTRLVTQKFFDVVSSWDLELSDKDHAKYASVGLLIATRSYRYAPVDVQVAIAIYTFLCITCDDPGILPNDVIRDFAPRFFSGSKQRHPILTHLVEHLAVLREHYATFSANAIAVSTLDFINAEMFVRDEGGAEVHRPEALGYIDYMRWKNGVGEAFVVFIWPKALFPETRTYVQAIPAAVAFICLCNDLLSFHKECKAGEEDNYVSQHAAIFHQSATHSLRDIVERMVSLDRTVKTLLGDTTPERRAWDSYVAGYIEFHLQSPRYCLKEVLPEFSLFCSSTFEVSFVIRLTQDANLAGRLHRHECTATNSEFEGQALPSSEPTDAYIPL
ncbi:hypothetical protein EUX98_g2330 [Antrodiella citrinella]|uniref:Terpene synthase n=1 Tax=Antrodiella citrinella TaxID=2447956 RepID=A0A4S4MZ99_9APHY|nr:hypothetical protein EUX98_g2330 [Antrodiella citrinella]